MAAETRYIEVPAPVLSEDGLTATVGFPAGAAVPLNVSACGDGVHAFKPLAWERPDDWVCVCGQIEPGWPVLRCPATVETILILDASCSHAECMCDD